MKYNSIIDAFKEGDIVIPIYMYKQLPELKISLESFIFLMYLRSIGNDVSFDVPKFSKTLGLEDKSIMGYVSELSSSGLIDIKVIKNDKGIMEEYIYLDNFYEKIGLKLANKGAEEISKEKEDTNNIFSILEKEIGKQLSPIEIEIVKGWKEANYSDDLIKEAIKEAVSNDAVSLRYIDKVLYNWNKDGVTTIEEVNKRRKNFKESKSKDNKKELFEYNWLDDNE